MRISDWSSDVCSSDLLGWLTYLQQDCSEASLPRQQWRAFGDQPYWAVTVARDGILFDRVGEVPLHYAARAGEPAGETLTWSLAAKGVDTRGGDRSEERRGGKE